MKSKIRVLFESLISCGKPAKGDDKDQGSIVTDDSKHAQQEQEHQKVIKDEQKHAQGHGLIVKHEPKIAQGQVKDETTKAKEQVQGAFVYRARITAYRKITLSSRQARSPPRRMPRSPPTG
ncbi:uncharacterized protein LOC132060131 [Lycium ferocissimum]|uniref:uncharacterized protein LOC132060131 n=1 Tax=Lycium ferocissimum TaxID=112874 RepID=UPI002816028C|nr:uncharacterized protein LOC132060131 [Lycium ferocissimum]